MYQDLESVQMLHDLIQTPDNFFAHIRRYSTSLTTTMIYGWRTPVFEVPHVLEMFKAMEEFMVLAQQALLYDWYPFLRGMALYLPGWLVPGQKRAKALFETEKRIFTNLFARAKVEAQAGTLKECE